jgi:hypothetical protein
MNLFLLELVLNCKDQAEREGQSIGIEQIEKVLPRLLLKF